MKNGLKLALTVVCLALVAACGGEDPASSSSSSSSGGGGSSTSTSSTSSGGGDVGGGGSSTSTSSTSTGAAGAGGSSSSGGEVCHPSEDDPQLKLCGPDDPCECNEMQTTSKEYCTAWEDEGYYLCPEDANICSPGHNQCGYDLPKGQDYVPPDPECLTYINDDTWANTKAEKKSVGSSYDENGQLKSGLAHLGPPTDYGTSFVISGKKIYWNQANRAEYESAEGEFSDNCQQITMRFYKPTKGDGGLPPYGTALITWVHHNE